MTTRLFAPAVAALVGLASPALAFHPHQWCGSHTTQRMVVTGGTVHSVVPMTGTVHTIVPTGMVHSFVPTGMVHSVVPTGTVHSFVPMGTVHTLVPGATGTANAATGDAQAMINLLSALRTGCSLVNPPAGNNAGGISAADVQRIKEDLDAIRANLKIPRTPVKGDVVPKPTGGKADGDAVPKMTRVEVSPRLLAIDAGLDEIEAVQRRTAELRAGAPRPEAVAAARRGADADLDEIEAIQRRTAELRAAAARTAPATPDVTAVVGRR